MYVQIQKVAKKIQEEENTMFKDDVPLRPRNVKIVHKDDRPQVMDADSDGDDVPLPRCGHHWCGRHHH
jgi:hypothetical protein